jgi:hypothetical protein
LTLSYFIFHLCPFRDRKYAIVAECLGLKK